MFNHTNRLRNVCLAAVPTLVLLVVGSSATATAQVTRQLGARATSVTCVNDVTRDTAALRSAISATAATGTITIAAGTCALNDNVPIHAALTVTGAGPLATFMVQHAASNIFQITKPGVTIENINLDTATFNPGPSALKSPKPAVLFSASSNTTVRNVIAAAGSGFGMRITGPNPCDSYQTKGTVVDNLTISNSGTGGLASLDIDCTDGAQLSNITVHGNYIAIYKDQNLTLNGEVYTPQAKSCQVPWYITGPVHNITIDNVTGGGHGISKGLTDNLGVTNQTQSLGC